MSRKLLALIMIIAFSGAALAELPVPEQTGVDMILGMRAGGYYTDISLYYEISGDTGLTNVMRTVYIPEGGSIAETAIEELFSIAETDEFTGSVPCDAKLSSMHVCGSIATVDLKLNMAGVQSDSELLALYMAVTNTLCAIDGIDYVNVLINGRQEPINGLPVGLLSASDSSVVAAWAGYQAESANFHSSAQSRIPLERTAALYFPSSNGQWVLPDIQTIAFETDDYALELMQALIKGSVGGNAYAQFLSGGISIMTQQPDVSVSSGGEKVLDVYLSGTLRDYMLLQGLSEWQLSGAISMTMLTFVPELDAVRINIDGVPVERLDVRGIFRDFDSGLIRLTDFNMFAGSVGKLYFAGSDGGLTGAERAMSAERAKSPYALMVQLISGPSATDGNAYSVMPAGTGVNDLLGVAVSEGVASVNMTANFYRRCQAMNEKEERLLVYAIVNTLCELPGINAVRILIEGEQVETLSDSIYLMGELLPNPGIIE